MARYATFRLLSPLLREDLARGYYARHETVSLAGDIGGTPTGTALIGLDDGRVVIGTQRPTSHDVFAVLGLCPPVTWEGGRTVAFGIGMPELVRRVVGTVWPNRDCFVVNDRTLVLGDLTRQDGIALLVEALAVLGEINGRRSPDRLAGDDGVGIERVFTRVEVHG